MKPNPTSLEIIEYFSTWNLDPESREYIQSHAWRYEHMLREIDRLIKQNQIKRILDIGCAYQTELLRRIYPEIVVDTMGFADIRFAARPQDKHIEYDLNLAQNQTPPEWKKYDLVIMAEVIEHLYTAPSLVLRFLHQVISPAGFLFIQTPNAVGLSKRIRMFFGRHPYEMLREDMKNPGHYREYTLPELVKVGSDHGFRIIGSSIDNDFRSPSLSNKVFNWFSIFLPPSMRRGITIIYKKT
jgi:trans-aconitate methyltransferase